MSYPICGEAAHETERGDRRLDATSLPVERKLARVLILLCVSVPAFMLNIDANVVAVSLQAIAHLPQANFAAAECWLTFCASDTAPDVKDQIAVIAGRNGG
jgi:hypothetical protein